MPRPGLCLAVGIACLAAVLPGWVWAGPNDDAPVELPVLAAERPFDGFVLSPTESARANLARHSVLLNTVPGVALKLPGKPADGQPVGLWKDRCSWEMPTPDAGDYVVLLTVVAGEGRRGHFAYFVGEQERSSAEFKEKGPWVGCTKAFRIRVPAGQARTRMFVEGNGLYLLRVDICRDTKPSGDGTIRTLAHSSYRTLVRGAAPVGAPACVVLVPDLPEEAQVARTLAAKLGIPTLPERPLAKPLPAPPDLGSLAPDTNVILVSAGRGGPLTQALRRAQWVVEDPCVPGPGGYAIRTLARPFASRANVIVISGSDAPGLMAGVAAFAPKPEAGSDELVHDAMLVEVPGKQWDKVRSFHYRRDGDPAWWKMQFDQLAKPRAGLADSRTYILKTAQWGDWYWRTGDVRFAELFKRYVLKMQNEAIYGAPAKDDGSHMELYGLLRGWDLCEEASVFSLEERLRIANYLLQCAEGREGFGRAYAHYFEYSGDMGMRHNHETILGCGMVQACLYFGRLYDLPRVEAWKQWCDDLIARGTRWGHGVEDSANYEVRTFLEVADMIRFQGLSTKGVAGTEAWPQAALRLAAATDSFALVSAYGDCWDTKEEWDTMEQGRVRFFQIMGEDWDWPAAQFLVDRVIRGYRLAAPGSVPTSDLYAYKHGSTQVGGIRTSSPPQAALVALAPLQGLAVVPMTRGYHEYLSGRIGNRAFWKQHPRPDNPPCEKTADKIQFRSGWASDDTYVLIETLGWANHGHLDLGALVQFCQGGRLWIVDAGYNNFEAHHHSTLEVARDGVAAWGSYPGDTERFSDFRAGPQMFEVVKLEPPGPGATDRFAVTCRAANLAGATWQRTISGGKNQPLVIEDTLTADQAGQYTLSFRLRLLGEVRGAGGAWTVTQVGTLLPVTLNAATDDAVRLRPWEPDNHAAQGGRYSFYPFVKDDGRPKTLELVRTVQLAKGQTTTIRVALGPAQVEDLDRENPGHAKR